MLERSFTEEQDSSEDSISKDEPEYVFEGFNIEFSEKVMLTTMGPPRSATAMEQSVSYQFSLDPDRAGTFIIPDIYPFDLHGKPTFETLPGLTVDGKEVVGCVVKATHGVSWAKSYENWFKNAWKRVREVASDRYGIDFFRGCYHFLVFNADGAKQADYFCDQVDAAGGWGDGDLMPWVDLEEGGQIGWVPQRLETIKDEAVLKRLADQVTDRATAFVKRFKERTGLRIAVYGRKLFHDLHMTNCRFGADSFVNPAYVDKLYEKFRMEAYGIPLDDIIFWQLQGTPESGKPGSNRAVVPGFPTQLGTWGQVDYSVYIDGDRKTTLKTLRQRCLARPR